jgi:hypothetical protein
MYPSTNWGAKGEIESHEYDQRRKTSPAFRVHAPANLGPPIVKSAEIGKQRPADHDVVEMRDDEICVADVNVSSQRSQEQSRHAANVNRPMKPSA